MATLTTVAQDVSAFDTKFAAFGKRAPTKVHGKLKFAGVHWPPKQDARGKPINALKYRDVEVAVAEARNMIVAAYVMATNAVDRDEAEAVAFMERWFGTRNTGTGVNDRDWWKGARAILGGVENFIMRTINAYYRGDDALVGEPNDYPNAVGDLDAYDVEGYAESVADDKDSVIGFCKLFFAKQNDGQAKMNLRGEDSVGGTLVHEMSHNICGTLDHYPYTNIGECYGTPNCLALATNRPSRAWYNADNIEYFCEDVYYEFSAAAAPAPVATGASQGVAALRAKFAGT